MLKGIYSAAGGMMSEMMASDISADNIANINTPGYKASSANFKAFGELLMNRVNGADNQNDNLGSYTSSAQISGTVIDFSQGDLQPSGNPLDLAIKGDGFFTIKNAADGKTLYTRAGNFTRNSNGYLATNDGSLVQGEKGDIAIPAGVKKIEISESGQVVADGSVVDTLNIAQFKNTQILTRMGASTYSAPIAPDGTGQTGLVEQGFLEKSNSNIISEMVSGIAGSRTYEALEKGIQMQNETLSKAVTQVGQVS